MASGAARLLVLDLQATAARWRLSPEHADVVRHAAPPEWRVHVVSAPTSSDGDGGSLPSEEALEAIGDAEVYFGFGISPPLFRAARKLRWVHSGAAGVASLLFPEMRASSVVVTNSAGIHAVPMAEHVLGGVLYLLRGLDLAVARQRERVWARDDFVRLDSPVRELGRCRALVIGAGGIGGEVAKRLAAFGAYVTGVRRRPELGAPHGFARMTGPGEWRERLPETDLLILTAPATSETRRMVTGAELDRLPVGAIVVNVARGSLLDQEALADRIERGALRGAVLDVFEQEPLPPDSRLWALSSVLVTPHVSPVTPGGFWPRQLELFLDNWRRYTVGEPLRNVVDKGAGY
ncbi:MAG: D-2-hydroxyacid dehydrogenase [Gemmatimonadaceae bacterium]